MGIEHNEEKHIHNLSWVLSIMRKNTGARSLLGMPSRDLQFTSSHSNLSLPNDKTYRKSFLVMIGMHLDLVGRVNGKGTKKKVLTVLFGKKQQSW